jgi:Glycosyltransferase 61
VATLHEADGEVKVRNYENYFLFSRQPTIALARCLVLKFLIMKPSPHSSTGVLYTGPIMKSIRIITITEEQAVGIKIKATNNEENAYFPPLQPTSFSSSAAPVLKETSSSIIPTTTSKIYTNPAPNENDYAASTVSLMGTLNSTGTFSRVRYRFDNVYLETENLLTVHLLASVPLPTNNVIVDGIHGDPPFVLANTEPPRAIHHRDIFQKQEHTLNISYTHPKIFDQDEHLRKEPLRKCTCWETRPVYLMYVPHPYNVWHVWNDALLGAYQTLREEGHLPLARIYEDGRMEEYTEGLDEECHWKIDLYGNGTSYRPEKCRTKTGILPEKNKIKSSRSSYKCSPDYDDWCRPGVVAFNRSNGPIILLAKGTIWPDRKWRHMFTALSEDIREWDDMVGTCFQELYIIKSHTLDFYTTLFSSYPNFPLAQKQRVGGMQAFQEVMATAERHHRNGRQGKNPNKIVADWNGYNNPDLEVLRQGIGPENIGALSVLRDIRTAGIEEGKLQKEEVEEVNRMRREETEDMLEFVREKQQAQEEEELRRSSNGGALKKQPPVNKVNGIAYPQFVPTPSSPRPVVTFMWRMSFKRCAVNEADILTYLLLRYNVTVRVTTFNEPLMETMNLMNSTDILIGMHGAGWTNAIFLKKGAAAMQLHPYLWLNPATKIPIRGGSYKAIIKAKDALYVQWINPFANYSFFRAADFTSQERRGTPVPYKYSLHPSPDLKLPYEAKNEVGSHWIYQNTLVRIRDIADKLDKMMELKGIMPMRVVGPELVEPAAVVVDAGTGAAAAAELSF